MAFGQEVERFASGFESYASSFNLNHLGISALSCQYSIAFAIEKLRDFSLASKKAVACSYLTLVLSMAS